MEKQPTPPLDSGKPSYLAKMPAPKRRKIADPKKDTRQAPPAAAVRKTLPPPTAGPSVKVTASRPPPHTVTDTQDPPSTVAASSSRIPNSLWEGKVPSELSRAIHPPRRFYERGRISNDEIKEFEAMESYGLKAMGFLHAYVSVSGKFNQAVDELEKTQDAKKKLEEELHACLRDKQKAEEQGAASREEQKKTYEELLQAKEHLSQARFAAAVHTESLTRLKTENEKMEGQLKDYEAELTTYQELLQESVEGAFKNCLSQVRFLNPDVALNLEGVDCRAYVQDGAFVPAPPAPEEPTASVMDAEQAEDAGDEADTGRSQP